MYRNKFLLLRNVPMVLANALIPVRNHLCVPTVYGLSWIIVPMAARMACVYQVRPFLYAPKVSSNALIPVLWVLSVKAVIGDTKRAVSMDAPTGYANQAPTLFARLNVRITAMKMGFAMISCHQLARVPAKMAAMMRVIASPMK